MTDAQNANVANTANATRTAEQTVKLRPTLYIGVGGTGMEVMMRVRRRILNASWGGDNVRLENLSQFPIAQFIHFDLDQGAIIDSGRAQTEDLQYNLVKFTDDEKIVESFDIEKYSRDDASLSRYPHIQNWLPLTPKKIRELGIDPAKGAGQIRSVSRLYFFDKYPKTRDKIRSKLNTLKAGLSRDDVLKKLNLQLDTSKFRIVVLGSVAGGTGSGSFLDMGWLSKWVASNEVEAADVELMLFLPTGYSSANKSRTEANAYAALMEVESAMVGHSKYVEKWDDYDRPQLASKPYDEVHLIDSGNLARQHTDNMNDVYSMIADTLFEDFRSADFANRKRSVAVNQRQHKIHMFAPPVPTGRFGDMKLNYSCAYSAFGQSTLDTLGRARYDEYAYSLASDMLKAFFGVASANPAANRASEKKRDAFMTENMNLNLVPFNNLPEFSAATLKNPEIRELNTEFMDLDVVDTLLRSGQNGVEVDTVEETRQRVSQRISEISNVDRDQWANEVRKTMQSLMRDVIRNPDAMADTAEDRVMRRRKALFESLKKDIESRLYQYLDNHEQGGFEYVISLVEQIKDRIENANSGIALQLKNSANRYTAIKDALLTYEYEKQLKDLEETKGKGLFGLGSSSREEQARNILDNLRKDIANILSFHLRAKAALEAIELMQDISNWLGNSLGVDESGRTIWNGVMGDLQNGQESVIDMMNRLDRDCEVIHQQIRTKHATLQIIETDDVKERNIDPRLLCEWAAEAFKDFGGSKELFKVLVDPDQQTPLLIKIIRMAERRLFAFEHNDQKEDSLYKALENMSVVERQNVFTEWLQRAMPWVDAKMGGDFTPPPDRFKCFIGVNGADQFSKKYKHELTGCIPSGLGLNAQALSIVETGEPGRAVCYVELSGVPLTILRGIETWRTSYRKESERTPLHTHIDSTRFKHPYAPTPDELNNLADDFKCYLKAVMLGVLKRCEVPGLIPTGQYEFAVARGDVRRLGNERGFRLNGLPQTYRDNIYEQVQQKFKSLSNANLTMLIALVDHYEREVYTPRLVQNEMGAQVEHVGFACAIAKELKKELIELVERKEIPQELIERAYELTEYREEMEKWAEVLKDSDEDAYQDEIREPNKGRRLKWVMNMSPSILQTHDQLLMKKDANEVIVPVVMSNMTPPPPPGRIPMPPPIMQQPIYQYHIAINGQNFGPYSYQQVIEMLQQQQINMATMVWREGLANWIAVAQCPELTIPVPPTISGMPPILQ
ncbi:tubulin-like doman-containing protein [Acinetobacter guillouiae]|uniref:tubulin-like doman-containing protein n=1 Tax=Acinetobacter guillouiae TaxID=106649 RepID=UPI003AF945BE